MLPMIVLCFNYFLVNADAIFSVCATSSFPTLNTFRSWIGLLTLKKWLETAPLNIYDH